MWGKNVVEYLPYLESTINNVMKARFSGNESETTKQTSEYLVVGGQNGKVKVRSYLWSLICDNNLVDKDISQQSLNNYTHEQITTMHNSKSLQTTRRPPRTAGLLCGLSMFTIKRIDVSCPPWYAVDKRKLDIGLDIYGILK